MQHLPAAPACRRPTVPSSRRKREKKIVVRMKEVGARREREEDWSVAEQIGESLLDPRNGSCPSKKERSGAGVAAAWQLPPTWDSPRSDSVFFVLLLVVVVVVVVCCYCCCVGLVACCHYRSRGSGGVHVFTCVTFVERRAVGAVFA
ncbi:hypothetical protein K0M31_003061 [Melipona bicolor]|uniref:Uncharacterized protein n=1 Tax=Melipona bicolor TaxID=60889 RepID=A0AA40G043_9HYME|nr:hypothetical protein K0M31_003061 [Melipona bicolor]